METNKWDTSTLVLPAGRLQKCSLHLAAPYDPESGEDEVRELLTAENIESLAEGGCLRFLELTMGDMYDDTIPAPPLDYLSRFASLVHLSVNVTSTNIDGLADVLAHLPHLRALELEEAIYCPETGVDWGGVAQLIAANRPELRHLAMRDEAIIQLAGSNVFTRLEQLVSLEITSHWRKQHEQVDWVWLEELTGRARLEHLIVRISGYPVPLDLACRVVDKCKVHPSTPVGN